MSVHEKPCVEDRFLKKFNTEFQMSQSQKDNHYFELRPWSGSNLNSFLLIGGKLKNLEAMSPKANLC